MCRSDQALAFLAAVSIWTTRSVARPRRRASAAKNACSFAASSAGEACCGIDLHRLRRRTDARGKLIDSGRMVEIVAEELQRRAAQAGLREVGHNFCCSVSSIRPSAAACGCGRRLCGRRRGRARSPVLPRFGSACPRSPVGAALCDVPAQRLTCPRPFWQHGPSTRACAAARRQKGDCQCLDGSVHGRRRHGVLGQTTSLPPAWRPL
jgi:hypothetical protein